jgi:hypothetical protein
MLWMGQKLNVMKTFVNYGHKEFYDSGTCGQSYKTFYKRNITFHNKFVPGKLFQAGLMFADEARSLP